MKGRVRYMHLTSDMEREKYRVLLCSASGVGLRKVRQGRLREMKREDNCAVESGVREIGKGVFHKWCSLTHMRYYTVFFI